MKSTLNYATPSQPRSHAWQWLRPYGLAAVPFLAALPALTLVLHMDPFVTVGVSLVLVIGAVLVAWIWWE